MAVEARRGCGYRKVGGTYLVSGKLSAPCGRLPLELHVCPTCHGGIKQSRGWTWVNAAQLLEKAADCISYTRHVSGALLPICGGCPLSPASLAAMGDRAGLLWVGGSFYPEAEDFMREARQMGVSRRIAAIPRGFEIGKHWVLIAHPRAVTRSVSWEAATEEEREVVWAAIKTGVPGASTDAPVLVVRKGIITAFMPTAIEKIVTETQFADQDAMAELLAKGVTPVPVPDDDLDHQGSVHDKDEDQPLISQDALAELQQSLL